MRYARLIILVGWIMGCSSGSDTDEAPTTADASDTSSNLDAESIADTEALADTEADTQSAGSDTQLSDADMPDGMASETGAPDAGSPDGTTEEVAIPDTSDPADVAVADCSGDDTQETACGLNGRGVQAQVCVAGAWSDSGECLDPDLCVDATTQPGTTACGLNDLGTLSETCTLGSWVASEACSCGATTHTGDWVISTAADIASWDGSSTLDGQLEIIGDFAGTDLKGLESLRCISGKLYLHDSNSVINFEGLDNVIAVGGDLDLRENTALTSLDGLENLRWLGGDLYVYEQAVLTSVTALAGLTQQLEAMDFDSNHELESLAGLEGITGVTDYLLLGSSKLNDISALQNLTSVDGSVSLYGLDNLADLSGLSGLKHVGTKFVLSGSDSLTSLSGLGITTVGGGLTIANTTVLTSLEPLSALPSNAVTGNLIIRNNDALRQCVVDAFVAHLDAVCDPATNCTKDNLGMPNVCE
jgi:hypothetical protein